MNSLKLELSDEAATLALGAALAPHVSPGMVVNLEGDLGAGKTTLVRGWLRALGETGSVRSPTYTLVEPHVVSGVNFYHIDLYRINQPEEVWDAGLDECFSEDAICLVEWPGKGGACVPAPDLRIRLVVCGLARQAIIETTSERGKQCLTTCKLPGANC